MRSHMPFVTQKYHLRLTRICLAVGRPRDVSAQLDASLFKGERSMFLGDARKEVALMVKSGLVSDQPIRREGRDGGRKRGGRKIARDAAVNAEEIIKC